MNPVKAYLTAIGRRGGQKSKRKLTKSQARAMVRARTAKRAALRVSVFLVLILVALGGLYFQAIHQRSKFIGDLERRIALIEPNARGIAEKREALNKWADRLNDLISPPEANNVVPFAKISPGAA